MLPLLKDAESEIHDFYPDLSEIKLDLNGKKFAWQAVVLLPFIDEQVRAFSEPTPPAPTPPLPLRSSSALARALKHTLHALAPHLVATRSASSR